MAAQRRTAGARSANTGAATPADQRGPGTLPLVAAVMVLLNGLYILLVAFGNITDYGTNHEFVQHVLSMDTTNFGGEPGTGLDDDVMWRAIESSAIQDIAYLGIIAWESVAAVILLAASVLWARELLGRSNRAGFATARRLSTIGLLMIVLLFFGGFIVVGGEWFQMWRSDAWNGLDPAFRNSALAAFGLVLLHLPSPDWGSERHRA